MRRKTYHLLKVMRPGHIARRIVLVARPVSRGVYAIPEDLFLELRSAIDDFAPYADDTDGRIWE
jgi:hypothetical protein